jgi:UDP-N-acetylglucosamine--N-acetylmuramyl-(pentapeptide) pyrophosphoryl-undecaprenol N-acetylglucosamine transferase
MNKNKTPSKLKFNISHEITSKPLAKTDKTLFVVASGSGGHILPALVLAKKWYEKECGKVIFFTSNNKLDQNILSSNNFIYKTIYLNLSKFPGKRFWLYPKFFYQLFLSFIKSLYYSHKFNPQQTIGTGGYLSIPVCVASKIFKSFIEIYELNVIPGKAVLFLTKIVNKIAIVFKETKNHFKKNIHNKIVLKEYPLRYTQEDKIFNKQNLINKINKQEGVSFSLDKKTIFLLGGSQGSMFLNNYLKKWLVNNQKELNNIQIIHQTGNKDKTDWKSFYKNLNIQVIVFSYKQDLKDYYLIADQVLTRAGAGTLFELQFFKKKSIIFPLLTKTTSHQLDNAKIMVKNNKGLFEIKQP